jgi:hypothetical protein
MPRSLRRCQHCNDALPPTARSDARFCSASCRARSHRRVAYWQRINSRSATPAALPALRRTAHPLDLRRTPRRCPLLLAPLPASRVPRAPC